MKYAVAIVVFALCLATISQGAEERWRYSNGTYNWTTSFGGTWHPGTLFVPDSGKYPVFLKTAHFGFGTGSVAVQLKIWSATGSTVGSVLASFPATTSTWPTWTDVDVTGASLVFPSGNFFISTNNPSMGPLGASFKGANPTHSGYHYWSNDDNSWSPWSTTDWAIECTVDTQHGVGVTPTSVGRVKALYR